jgi:hypothetical protein
MNYLKGINYWGSRGFGRTRLTPAPASMPNDMQNLGSGFLGGNEMNNFGFQPPITHLQNVVLSNLTINSQGGITAGSQQIIIPAFNNTNNSE